MIFPAGATSQSVDAMFVDDNGLPVTGKVAADFPTLTYSVAGANADVAFPALSDLAALTTAYASGGVKERGNGYYRLDVPNGCFTVAGATRVRGEASGKHVIIPEIQVGVQVASVTGAVASVTAGVSLAAGAISDTSFTTPADGTGQAGGMVSKLLWVYNYFFGKKHYDKAGQTIKTYQSDGITVRTTQAATTNGTADDIGAAT